MKQFISAVMLSLLPLSSSCERRSTSTQRTATPTPSPIWLDARITRSRDRFYSEDFVLLDHRFATASGERSTYDAGSLRLAIAPRANGDHTITIAATLTEGADTTTPAITESGSITVVDGRATTHQVGGIRFIFTATTDAQHLIPTDTTKPASTFVEGAYILPPRYLAGDSYTFRNGGFTCHSFTDAPPPGGMPPPEQGRYHIDGERITLSFDGAVPRTRTFHHRLVDGIHLLLDERALPSLESHRRLPTDQLYSFYILSPPESEDFWTWWRAIPSAHPNFAKLLPEGTF